MSTFLKITRKFTKKFFFLNNSFKKIQKNMRAKTIIQKLQVLFKKLWLMKYQIKIGWSFENWLNLKVKVHVKDYTVLHLHCSRTFPTFCGGKMMATTIFSSPFKILTNFVLFSVSVSILLHWSDMVWYLW